MRELSSFKLYDVPPTLHCEGVGVEAKGSEMVYGTHSIRAYIWTTSLEAARLTTFTLSSWELLNPSYMSIYTLPNDIRESLESYYRLFDSETGELIWTDEELALAQTQLDDLVTKTWSTTEWYLKDRLNKIAYIDWIKSEIDRMQKIVERNEKDVARSEMLIDRIFDRVYGGEKTTIGTFVISYTKSESCSIDDETKIPKEYLRITPEKIIPESSAPDKVAIKTAINAGKEIPWASVLVKKTLKIK